jgi:WD40 repeat protein
VVTCYPSGTGYAVGSIEGRCAIQYVDANEQSKLGFSFKCHRETRSTPRPENVIYPLNAISFHPVYGTFSTAGSDGTFHFWDKDSKYRLKGSGNVGGSIACTAFNRNGKHLRLRRVVRLEQGPPVQHPKTTPTWSNSTPQRTKRSSKDLKNANNNVLS